MKQRLACPSQSHPTHPSKRRRAQKSLEVGLEGSRTNARGAGEGFKLNRLRKMAAKPLESAHQIGRDRRWAVVARGRAIVRIERQTSASVQSGLDSAA